MPLAEGRGVRVEGDPADAPAWVSADCGRLRQALAHLVSAPSTLARDGAVRFQLGVREDRVTLLIEDEDSVCCRAPISASVWRARSSAPRRHALHANRRRSAPRSTSSWHGSRAVTPDRSDATASCSTSGSFASSPTSATQAHLPARSSRASPPTRAVPAAHAGACVGDAASLAREAHRLKGNGGTVGAVISPTSAWRSARGAPRVCTGMEPRIEQALDVLDATRVGSGILSGTIAAPA